MAVEATAEYGYRKRTHLPFEQAMERIKTTLSDQGFGILMEIDVAETLKAKIDADIGGRYTILGACKPPLAFKALQAERELGLLLPCNVIVYEDGDGTVVSSIEPMAALGVAGTPALMPIAEEAAKGIRKAIDNV